MNGAVARRYARALFALEEGARGELETLSAAFADPAIAPSLSPGALDRKSRARLVESLLEKASPSPMVANLLRLLAENDRLDVLGEITDAYRALADRKAGRVAARIVAARPLSDELLAGIRKRLESLTGKTIEPDVGVDDELLGGVTVEVEGRVYDGSTRTRLERLREALAG